MSSNTSNLLYLVPIASFVLALRFLSSPKHARLGNQIGSFGMLVAVVVTLLRSDVVTGWWWMIAGGAIGSVIGLVGARKVNKTSPARTMSSASRPLPASATTVKSTWSAKNLRKPARTVGWSSTIAIRIMGQPALRAAGAGV